MLDPEKFKVGDTFDCGEYTLKIIEVSSEGTIRYTIKHHTNDVQVRTDARYAHAFAEALTEYGY